jgi:hypothetical protein
VNPNSDSLKLKFGVTTGGSTGVRDTFIKVHEYIVAGGLNNPSTNVIRLGDYIDLEAGLTVEAYGTGTGTGGFTVGAADLAGNNTPLLRLIVVGINSFHSGRGVKEYIGVIGTTAMMADIITVNGDNTGQYTQGPAKNNTPHVVFQFKNLPTKRRMEATRTNQNGYLGSEMRKYLVPTGHTGSGRFLDGLIAAGVPEDVLWAPVRYIANKGYGADGIHTIEDTLWLPTEREMFGYNSWSNFTWETADNQAHLEYYENNSRRDKFTTYIYRGWSYFLASPYAGRNSPQFCRVNDGGGPVHGYADDDGDGVAPAFCVQ